MTKENLIPKTEMVYEIKNETPSFEEFMKNYEADENVISSYRDEVEYVNGWASKGSGPCSSCRSGSVSHNKRFNLRITLRNAYSRTITKTVYNTYDASIVARDIENRSGYWKDNLGFFSSDIWTTDDRKEVVESIQRWINHHNSGNEV